eukprot:309666_1
MSKCVTLRSQTEIDHLVRGYVKTVFTKHVPNEIIILCLLMYGNDLFRWQINANQLTDLLNESRSIDHHSLAQLNSSIFSFQRIKFRLFVGLFNVYVRGMDTFVIGLEMISKNVKVTAMPHVTCNDPYYDFKEISTFLFPSQQTLYCGKATPGMSIHNNELARFNTKDLNKRENIILHCNVNILQIELISNITTDIKSYYKNIKMKQIFNYDWSLNDSLNCAITNYVTERRTNVVNKRLYYVSPINVDSGNWYFQYTETGNMCNVSLHLLLCPLQISCIKLKWTLHIHYNDYSRSMSDVYILKVCPNNLRFSRRQSHIIYNSNKWIKEYDTKNLILTNEIKIIRIWVEQGAAVHPENWKEFGLVRNSSSNIEKKRIEVHDLLFNEFQEKMYQSLKPMYDEQQKMMKGIQLTLTTLTESIKKIECDIKDIKDEHKDDNCNKIQINGVDVLNMTDITQWLTFNVGLPKYHDAFISNGYESLEFIKEIKNKAELDEIGIKLKGHQTKIMSEINKLKK